MTKCSNGSRPHDTHDTHSESPPFLVFMPSSMLLVLTLLRVMFSSVRLLLLTVMFSSVRPLLLRVVLLYMWTCGSANVIKRIGMIPWRRYPWRVRRLNLSSMVGLSFFNWRGTRVVLLDSCMCTMVVFLIKKTKHIFLWCMTYSFSEKKKWNVYIRITMDSPDKTSAW